MPTKEEVTNVLKQVKDPEIGMDIITLNLVYEVRVENGSVYIRMTFTTPFCPYGPALVDDMKKRVRALEGVSDVNVEVVFDPPWQPSEELRVMFGIGVR
ncbi:MAG: metal-sulfur cluster assembly factor [Candidatus Aenigmatarchaeota archaeon]|nr:MAG: metal-sulfur cluster assembly factor [Candidatus Aenigmarchaeota archaeon]